MIRSVKLTLEVTCDDGTILEIPVSTNPSLVDVEDARCLFQLNHSIESSVLSKVQSHGGVAFDEELLRVLLGRLRKEWGWSKDSWPDGKEAEDVIDRLAIMLAGRLRLRGAPPPP